MLTFPILISNTEPVLHRHGRIRSCEDPNSADYTSISTSYEQQNKLKLNIMLTLFPTLTDRPKDRQHRQHIRRINYIRIQETE